MKFLFDEEDGEQKPS